MNGPAQPLPERRADRARLRLSDVPLRAVPPAGQAPAPEPPPRHHRRWESWYHSTVVGSDLVIVLLAAVLGSELNVGGGSPFGREGSLALAAVTAVALTGSLAVHRVWDPRMLGAGSEEYARIVRATVTTAMVLGLLALAVGVESLRAWVFVVVPIAGVTMLLARWLLRRLLHARRSQNRCLHPVLAVGPPEWVADMVARTTRSRHHGWVVGAACTPSGTGESGADTVADVPVVGDFDTVKRTVWAGGYDIVAVAPAPGWSPRRLQQLAWDLEGTGTDLVVDPGLMEVAGPRLHVAPVDGFPLLRLTEPAFTGIARLVKGVMDRIGALLLLVITAPLMLTLAIAVRRDGGPAFYMQTRTGKGGEPFRMVKFRSMVVDADRHRAALASVDEGAGPLFKMRRDPRVTPVGRWLRRYSLDELPQLFNVLTGSMSLVGPRPPLPEEVAVFTRDAHRRLLVKPGMTGLWQVSGRSDLSWEESVRLDLRYVENWTLAMDMSILWKTLRAARTGAGAY
ncbi:sugar transferase [Pseudonocardia sp.]|uniref:sugar transferase n=1 Tax=Pseudonocardia sp. TaxID=60912 RepID=UPI003D140F97